MGIELYTSSTYTHETTSTTTAPKNNNNDYDDGNFICL